MTHQQDGSFSALWELDTERNHKEASSFRNQKISPLILNAFKSVRGGSLRQATLL